MKRPNRAPTFENVAQNLKPEEFSEALRHPIEPVDSKGRYLHWEELQHRWPPHGLSLEQWWLAIKLARRSLYRALPLKDEAGKPFVFGAPDIVQRRLHWVDRNASGQIGSPEPLTSEHRNMYLINSLIEEAIRSSQLEGAATTRAVAKQMIRDGREPQDKSEQMIFNNYRAMQQIREVLDEPLTPELINELHRVVSLETLDDPNRAGTYRQEKDNIHVVDRAGINVLHTPPPAKTLPERVQAICDFANDPADEPNHFIHPLIKAILLHFAIGYEHPFVDGNGRTARALFYWYALRTGYWLLEFVSISRVLRQAPAQYDRAYLLTETDENDTTYFIIHQLGVIETAIKSLHDYLQRKTKEMEVAKRWLASGKWKERLNHRQLALLRHALRKPNAEYTFQTHANTHNCVYQTARTDLLGLEEEGLLNRFGKAKGKGYVFRPTRNLKQVLEKTNK